MKIGIVGKSRYIDANKLIERLIHNPDFLTAPKHSKDGIIDEIVYQPTADVVEVVRCKDCKYFKHYSVEYKQEVEKADGDCHIRLMNSDNKQYCACQYNDYCSYGERREE